MYLEIINVEANGTRVHFDLEFDVEFKTRVAKLLKKKSITEAEIHAVIVNVLNSTDPRELGLDKVVNNIGKNL
jgi:hypothetical protein